MVGVTKIVIQESSQELKEQMNQQIQAKARERLQALYLLKSGHCAQITEIAKIVGRSRSTIHRWFHHYQQGGLLRLIGPGNKAGRKALVPDWAVSK